TSWERLVPDGATLDDLDPNKITAYVRRVGPAAEGDPLAFLFRRGCLARRETRDWRLEASETGPASSLQPPASSFVPTNAGLLLFGAEVERYFPQCEVTLVRYRAREMSDEFLREDVRDTLVETVRRAEIWLSEHMRHGSRMIGLEREDWVQFPLGAVREALLNAVPHRDYATRRDDVRIALFCDRMGLY